LARCRAAACAVLCAGWGSEAGRRWLATLRARLAQVLRSARVVVRRFGRAVHRGRENQRY
jgi:ABC-type Fe3+ transport system substrate-binding protein